VRARRIASRIILSRTFILSAAPNRCKLTTEIYFNLIVAYFVYKIYCFKISPGIELPLYPQCIPGAMLVFL